MGNEGSSPVDESTPPNTLAGRTIEALAEYMKSGKAKNVVVMTGAGISTSAGIPDFRSPDTGLYANLARLNLPYAEAVFDINYFRKNPEPFYTLAHELYPGRYRPTITHSFIRLLYEKGILLKHFTQNIDCLDREAGVPAERIVEAHGSFAKQSCIDCNMPYPEEYIKLHIEEKTIPRCELCKGLVKPEIVFFGEQLPAEFFQSRGALLEADLCIVMGTSLTVAPFSMLPEGIERSTPRVLINKEQVGGFGSRADDVLLIGDCDEGVRQLAKACDWLEELERLWAETAPKAAAVEETRPVEKESKDENLEDEIDKLTKEVDETLNLSKWHDERVRKETASTLTTAKRDTEATTSAMPHEDQNGSLSHVFVTTKDAASSTTPVVPTENGQTSGETRGSEGEAGQGTTPGRHDDK